MKGRTKRNPYTAAECNKRKQEGKPLPPGTWVKAPDGTCGRIWPYSPTLIDTGEKTTGYMHGEPVVKELCSDENLRPAMTGWREWRGPVEGDQHERARTKNPADSSEASITRYEAVMERGEWKDNPADCFVKTTDSGLENGSQRSAAAFRTGRTIWVMVVEGAAPAVQNKRGAEQSPAWDIDTGRKRSLGDSIYGIYRDCPTKQAGALWGHVAREILRGPLMKGAPPKTRGQVWNFIGSHLYAFRWITETMASQNGQWRELRDGVRTEYYAQALRDRSIIAAFLRAYIYHRRDEREGNRVQMLYKKLYTPEKFKAAWETAGTVLQRRIQGSNYPRQATLVHRRETFHIVERAIKLYIDGTEKRLQKDGQPEELFLLPEEQADEETTD